MKSSLLSCFYAVVLDLIDVDRGLKVGGVNGLLIQNMTSTVLFHQ